MKFSYTCACEKVKIDVDGDMLFSAYCHCTQCRRTCAAPYFQGAGFVPDDVTITGEVKGYAINKMPRCFCPNCGTYVYGDAREHGFGDAAPAHYIIPASLVEATLPGFPGSAGRPNAPVAPMHVECGNCVLPNGLPDDGLNKLQNYPLTGNMDPSVVPLAGKGPAPPQAVPSRRGAFAPRGRPAATPGFGSTLPTLPLRVGPTPRAALRLAPAQAAAARRAPASVPRAAQLGSARLARFF